MGSENIGSRLKEVRGHLDLPQKAFAKLIGVTQTTISGIESGRANPSRQLLKNVCMRFGVSEDWLAEGEGNMLCISGSGQTAAAGGDLISRGALVEAAPSVPDRIGKCIRCDECAYLAKSKEGIHWCRSAQGLAGDLHPESGEGCSRGMPGKGEKHDNDE